MQSRYNRQIMENGLGGAGDIDPYVIAAAATLKISQNSILVDSTDGAFAITLPGVSEARGMIFSATMIADAGNVTIQDQDDSYGNWSDLVLTAVQDHVCIYSDGLVWHVLHDTTT